MNPTEVARIRKEHPNEPECVKFDRVLGAIAVTRGEYFPPINCVKRNHIFNTTI
jgi:hypothetical protein